MGIDSKTYKKILSGDLTLHNYTDFKRAIESAYNNYDFDEAQKGIYKLINSDFNELKEYYKALKICFYATSRSDNLFDPLQQLFSQAKYIKYLKIASALNLLIILYGFVWQIKPWHVPYLLGNLFLIVFLGQYADYNRPIMCTSCLKFTIDKAINDRRFCYRCHHDLQANLREESITFMEERLKNKFSANETLKIEYHDSIAEMNEFIQLLNQEKIIKRAFARMENEKRVRNSQSGG